MNTKITFALAVVTTAGFVAGIGVGRRTAGSARPASLRLDRAEKSSSIPKPAGRREVAAANPAADEQHEVALDDVMSLINKAIAEPNVSKRYEALQKLAKSIAVGDIPKVVTLAETISNPDLRSTLIWALLGRWAESDPNGAMAYAQAIANLQQQQQFIIPY